MPSLREIRGRIASTKDIQKITKAMQTVAGVRLRRAQERLFSARPYARKLDEMLTHLAAQTADEAHSLLTDRDVKASTLVVVTADRGFCGSFNTSVIRRAMEHTREASPELGLICVGRKGAETLSRQPHVKILEKQINIFQALEYDHAGEIADRLMELFNSGQVDRVEVVYNEFKSAGQQNLVLEQILPVIPQAIEEDPLFSEYQYEPSQKALLDDLVPRHIRFQIWRVLLESNAAEEAARMLAMDNATRNAGDLIDELALKANKMRQETITSELMDIIGGAEALR